MGSQLPKKVLPGFAAILTSVLLFVYLNGYVSIRTLKSVYYSDSSCVDASLLNETEINSENDVIETPKWQHQRKLIKQARRINHKVTEIIFLETGGNSSVTSRQVCAVESAARAHPKAKLYFYHSAPQLNDSDPLTALLLNDSKTFGNVYPLFLNATLTFRDTPLAEWYARGEWKDSPYRVNHVSDALRLAVLYKRGGVYMDLDVIVLRPLERLGNFVGLQEKNLVANGVMGFTRRHPFLHSCMVEFNATYRPDLWSHNGPELITRVLKDFCEGGKLDDVSPERCKGISAVPPHDFYPVHWKTWNDYFDAGRAADVIMGWTGSYLIHVWNRISSKNRVPIGSGQPYELAVKHFCPSVYQYCKPKGFL